MGEVVVALLAYVGVVFIVVGLWNRFIACQ